MMKLVFLAIDFECLTAPSLSISVYSVQVTVRLLMLGGTLNPFPAGTNMPFNFVSS